MRQPSTSLEFSCSEQSLTVLSTGRTLRAAAAGAYQVDELVEGRNRRVRRQALLQQAEHGAKLPLLHEVPPLVQQLVVIVNGLDGAAILLRVQSAKVGNAEGEVAGHMRCIGQI